MKKSSSGVTLLVCLGMMFLAGNVAALADGSPSSLDNSKTVPPVLRGVGIDQRLNQQVPLDLLFRDETGKTVALGDYFGKKPVVLALVYYQCPMLCTMVLNGMLDSLKQLKFDVGDQFNVVTVSFDPTEKPSLAKAKKAVYVGLYGRKGAAEGWHFLTGDEPSIRALTQAVGFHYNPIPENGQFAHATGIMVLTPEGKLARYFYGIRYPAGDLRLALVEASAHKIGSPVDALILYCCEYNAATGKYGVVISRLIQLAGALTVVVVGGLMLLLFRREGHARI
ncbi:MAG TPA: SCO family protein [Terriglobia bacterium]|nr:SCO family protein [Terriglobia bacterium]